MPISIATTERFLNEMLGLPRDVSKQVPALVKKLKEGSAPGQGGGSVKLRKYRDCYRIYVGSDYRLIYSERNNWITLLSICNRKDCYKSIPDPIFQQEAEDSISSNFDELKTVSVGDDNKFNLTQEKLSDWGIPKEYQDSFMNLKKIEDEILYIENVPHKFINRVLDILFPTELDINSQAELVINSESDLDKIISGEITEFLLKLSDKQKQIAELECNSSILVKGAPGTGKSTLALYRVKYLVDKGVKDILFTTYTDSLANYSRQLLTSLLGQDPEQLGVRIKTIDEIAYEYYQAGYQKTPKFPPEEGIDFLNTLIHTSPDNDKALALRLGTKYILEEINLIIEARNIKDFSKYKNEERYGRKYGLNENQKKSIWNIYERWSVALKTSGYINAGKMRQEALKIVEGKNEKVYDAVIIDEAQDLSPVALTLLALIVKSPEGLYLTADTSQSIYQRGFSWNYILPIIAKSGNPIDKLLSKSYRSTESISRACIQIIKNQADADSKTLTFDMSSIRGEKPKIILNDSWLIEPIKGISKNRSIWGKGFEQLVTKTSTIKER